MPYTLLHKAATRSRVLGAARLVFAFKGYEATSINDVMQAGGMTRGAFYAHFESKAALYREAMHMPYDAETVANVLEALKLIVDQQGESSQRSWAGPLPPVQDMLSDVPEVRGVVEAALVRFIERCTGKNGSANATRDEALALVSMAVGAAVLGGSVVDGVLATEIRESSMRTASRFVEPVEYEEGASSLFWAPEPCGTRDAGTKRLAD